LGGAFEARLLDQPADRPTHLSIIRTAGYKVSGGVARVYCRSRPRGISPCLVLVLNDCQYGGSLRSFDDADDGDSLLHTFRDRISRNGSPLRVFQRSVLLSLSKMDAHCLSSSGDAAADPAPVRRVGTPDHCLDDRGGGHWDSSQRAETDSRAGDAAERPDPRIWGR